MSAKIAAIVIPLGYVSDEDFAKDCGFELAKDTITIPRAQHEALIMALDNSQSLLVAMLHEQRPEEEIEIQIVENRAALKAALSGKDRPND